ncbi:MAG: methyltransferase [Clostridiaceae bacterium]|jgi:putative Mg2+ transporter-C (MgtC) family protein|nr:methyltransferase [Clostridiaceae bacterium]
MKVYEVILRLIIAIIVGGVIGYEREYKNRPAGFRTHILVCLGACVISMIQLYDIQNIEQIIMAHPDLSGSFKADIGRLGAQVISGIGFLGAGTIIQDKGSVKGLTTAASLWVVACIGLAIGLGYYSLTLFSTIAVVISLVTLKKFETRFLDKMNIVKLEITYLEKKEAVNKVTDYFEEKNIKVKNIEFSVEDDGDQGYKSLYTLLVPRYIKLNDILKDLGGKSQIIKVNIV